jgi:asparagine synthase (glutamine-hydrolysing)
MCGISAIVGTDRGLSDRLVRRMAALQHHRGPDGTGVAIERSGDSVWLALGHNRLAILDLTEAAAQPMVSADQRFVLIYNGEVYNYLEIARELPENARPAPGSGDTAVILAALSTWGPKALNRFNGMWSLLLFDRQERTLLISRDRFGVKPLCYGFGPTGLVLASEVKAVLMGLGARVRLNPNATIPYLTRGLMDFSEDTFFEGVRQFPPASYVVLDLSSVPTRMPPAERYWLHPFECGQTPRRGFLKPEDLRSLFEDAVSLRLRSDVPVGVLLSGGVDSSAILGAARTALPAGDLRVLAVTSEDPESNEEPFIDLASNWNNVSASKVNVSRDPMLLFKQVGESCWYNDAPLTSVAAVAHRMLMQRASDLGLKVLLSGQGADEQLAGYNKFLYFYAIDLLRKGNLSEASTLLFQFALKSNTLYEFRIAEALRYVGRERLVSGTFIARAHHKRDYVNIGLSGTFARREWLDIAKTSVPALLHYEDRMSMSHSVEIRVPFLDYRVVEALAQVDVADKLAGGWTKALFRDAIAGLVPPEIQFRKDKRGFTVPDDVWVSGQYRPELDRTFKAPMLAAELGIIDPSRLLEQYRKFCSGRGYLTGRHFFRMFALESFLRRFQADLSG